MRSCSGSAATAIAGSVAVDNLTVGVAGQTQLTDFEPGDGHIAVNTTTAPGLGFGFVNESNPNPGMRRVRS